VNVAGTPDAAVLVVDGPGTPLGSSDAIDLVARALESGAQGVATSVDRIDPSFFELRTGVAGEVAQKFVTYRFPLVIVGPLPPGATKSSSFAAFVREANRGTQLRFMDTMERPSSS
jgi:fructokinase